MTHYYLAAPNGAPFAKLLVGTGLSATLATGDDGLPDLTLAATGSVSETDPVFNAWLLATPPLYTEIDPVFSAWDKTTGIVVTESQISNLQSYLLPTGDGTDLTGVLHASDIADMATQTWIGLQGFYVGDGSAFATAAQGALADTAVQGTPWTSAGYLTNISGQDLSTADNTTSAFITSSALGAWNSVLYPADAAGVLTNDGNGNLSWGAGSGATWETLGGTQSDVNVGGFTNDAGYLTAETEPAYSANTYATGMNQSVATTATATFAGVDIMVGSTGGMAIGIWSPYDIQSCRQLFSGGFGTSRGIDIYAGQILDSDGMTVVADWSTGVLQSREGSNFIAWPISSGCYSPDAGLTMGPNPIKFFDTQLASADGITLKWGGSPILTDISSLTAGSVASLLGHSVSELPNDAGYISGFPSRIDDLIIAGVSAWDRLLGLNGYRYADIANGLLGVADWNYYVGSIQPINTLDWVNRYLLGSWSDGLGNSILTSATGFTPTGTVAYAGDNISEFTNDAGYITVSSVPTAVSQLSNDAGYYVGDGSAFATAAQGATADSAVQGTPWTSQGYLTGSNSVSDLFGGSTVASNAYDGETAYGWGNHASAGYLTDISSLTSGAVSSLSGHNVSELTNDSGYLTTGSLSGVTFGTNLYFDSYGIFHVAAPSSVIRFDEPFIVGGVLFGSGATDVKCSGSMGSATIDFGGGITSLTYQMNTILTVANSVSDLTGGSTVASNASDGETAYGWGNHASAGYLVPTGTVAYQGDNVSEFTNDAGYLTTVAHQTHLYDDATDSVIAYGYYPSSFPTLIVPGYICPNEAINYGIYVGGAELQDGNANPSLRWACDN